MKFGKFTILLLNIFSIIFMALLIKLLMTFPINSFATPAPSSAQFSDYLCDLAGFTLIDCSGVKGTYKLPELGRGNIISLENGMEFKTDDPLAFLISHKRAAIFAKKTEGVDMVLYKLLIENESGIHLAIRIK